MTPAGPLDGVRVVEIAQGVSGPFCGKLLGGLGASVIKVEPMGTGDITRSLSPHVPATDPLDGSALFHHLNTGKQSLTLDTANVSGRAILDKLITEWADVVVTSVPPTAAREAGLTFEQLRQLRPSIVVVSVTDFGDTGPYAEYTGSEIAALALGGYLYLTGDPDREPLKPWGYQAGYHAGLHAATGAVAALLRAEASGTGEHVDASAVEAASFLSSAAPGWSYFYSEPSRVGNRNTSLDPKQGYPSTMRPCRDGWVHAHGNMRDQGLLEVLIGDPELGRPEVLSEPKGHADEIDAIMDRWLEDRDRREVVEMAQALRLPFTEVLTPEEVVNDRHLAQRETLVPVAHPSIGVASYPHAPIKFGRTPWVTTRAPKLGEHTLEILTNNLRLSSREITGLRAKGVV